MFILIYLKKIEFLILELKLKLFRMATRYGIIDNCIKTASNYDGKVFGGYIRDVVVPKMQDPLCKCQFKDVDIWFKTDIDADMFVNDIKDIYNFQIVPSFTLENTTLHYAFGRTQYRLRIDNIVISFDIVVSECFPVDDFNVNFLSYCYKDNKEVIGSESQHFSKDLLINSINNKKAIILPSYVERLILKNNIDVHVCRINRSFLCKGWSIKYKNIYFPTHLSSLWVIRELAPNYNTYNVIRNSSESIIDFNDNIIRNSSESIIDFNDNIKENNSENNCIIS